MKISKKKWSLIGLVIALAITSVVYRIIEGMGHSHSGLMFVGLPAILSILLIVSGPSSTAPAKVFQGVTLFLLMVGILAWEGLICILMAAPIFYLCAFIVLWLYSLIKDRSKVHCIVVVPLMIFGVEGTHSNLEFDRENRVELIRVLEIDEADFLGEISDAPVFGSELPLFFRTGFPVPLACSADGSFLGGDQVNYFVQFSGPKGRRNELRIAGERISQNEIEFEFIEDSTKIGSWMTWEKASLQWITDGDDLIVTWSVTFQRNLDPSWYFTPIQNYAVRRASHHLLSNWIDESN